MALTLQDGTITATVAPEPGRVDLTAAFDAIKGKRRELDNLFAYYDGPQPLRYSTEKLEELFSNINAHFEQNWMSIVVDSTLDRIQLNGFATKGKDASADDRFKDIFDRLHIDIEADKAHQASLVTSQAYVIVWKQDNATVLYYNDPRLCHVFYEDANPNVKRFAAKWFNLADGRQEITLYYADRIEHWLCAKQSGTMADRASAFQLASVEGNTFGVIPVFELRSPGEIFKVLTSQDAINVLFSDMLTAAEFGALPQKYIISNADVGSLKNSANEIWSIPAGDGVGQQTQVGQFQPATLETFSAQMEKIANHIFISTRTPLHYLMGTGANISGEALLAMEAPLNKKCKKRQNLFASQWQDIAAFIAQLEGLTVSPDDITCQWERVESIQPLTEAQVLQTRVNAGIPLEVQLKKDGWTDAELADLKAQKAAAAKQRTDALLTRVNSIRQPMPMDNPNDNNTGVNNNG